MCVTCRGGAVDYAGLSQELLAGAMRVHTKLGPGLLEGAYQACLAHELGKRGLPIAQQVPISIEYDEMTLEVGYRLDILVAGKIVVEIKAVEKLLPIHSAQLLSYLRLGGYHLGFLLNFNTTHLRHGIKRVINGYEAVDRQNT